MEITKPLKAIREKCLDCCGYQQNEVRLCTCVNCPLFAFRMGKNPYRTRELTEEQKQEAAERLRRAREAKNEP